MSKEILDIVKNTPMDAIHAELCRRDFFYFIQQFWHVVIPEEPVYNWHIPYLAGELQKVANRVFLLKDKQGKIIKNREPKEADVIINIPPGTSKSTICTQMFPAWCWTIDPTLRIMSASYSSTLSMDHSVKSRDIIKSTNYKKWFPDIALKDDQDNKTHYKNTLGGERYATSVTGTIMGFHAHIIIVDDPLNANEAASEVGLANATNFMDRSLSTRKVNKSVTPTILIMQRLHALDPSGNWLSKVKQGKDITHYCLPAEVSIEVKPPELAKYYTDGLLDPVRLTKRDIINAKTDLGSYGYSGQYAQTPSPQDGGVWQRWFIPVDDDKFPTPEQLSNYGTDWDLAYTENQKNSASACIVSGKIGTNMYIDWLDYGYFEFPDLIKFMKKHPDIHYIENKASGKSAKQSLVSQGILAKEVKVNGGDKIARANAATPNAEAGFVYVRKSIIERLYSDEKQGILRFPNGEADDLADALAQAIQRHFLRKNSW